MGSLKRATFPHGRKTDHPRLTDYLSAIRHLEYELRVALVEDLPQLARELSEKLEAYRSTVRRLRWLPR